jgi:hypothetical protein
MKRIYESANLTIVWLGIPQTKDMRALKLLQKIEHAELQNPNVEGPMMVSEKLYPNRSSAAISRAFASFFSNGWFTRAWVQQEFAVSKDILFIHGEYSFAPVTVRHAINKNFFELKNIVFQPNIMFEYRVHKNNQPTQSLASLLKITFGQLKASDPRDHIFSLLGLAEADERSLLLVNYEASVEDVFVDTMSQCILYHPEESFAMLAYVGYWPHGEYRKSLPS